MRARGLTLPVLALALWELAGRTVALPSDSITRPSDVAVALMQAGADGSLLRASMETLAAAASGFLIAASLGVAIAIPIGLFKSTRNVVSPMIELLRPVPPVALIPVSLLMFGFGNSMEVTIVAFACIWPVLVISVAAVRGIEPRLIEVARNFELSMAERVAKIVLPFIMPRLFVGLRLGAGIALVVAVTVEIATNPRGLGYELILAQQNLRPDRAYGLLLWIGCVGWLLNAALLAVERGAFGYMSPARQAAR